MDVDDLPRVNPSPLKAEHYCDNPGCKAWGGFGFARGKLEPVRWWCWEHYPYKAPGKSTANGPLPSQA
jgi:hypothetical protein